VADLEAAVEGEVIGNVITDGLAASRCVDLLIDDE
jgi:hypothetical protein